MQRNGPKSVFAARHWKLLKLTYGSTVLLINEYYSRTHRAEQKTSLLKWLTPEVPTGEISPRLHNVFAYVPYLKSDFQSPPPFW